MLSWIKTKSEAARCVNLKKYLETTKRWNHLRFWSHLKVFHSWLVIVILHIFSLFMHTFTRFIMFLDKALNSSEGNSKYSKQPIINTALYRSYTCTNSNIQHYFQICYLQTLFLETLMTSHISDFTSITANYFCQVHWKKVFVFYTGYRRRFSWPFCEKKIYILL